VPDDHLVRGTFLKSLKTKLIGKTGRIFPHPISEKIKIEIWAEAGSGTASSRGPALGFQPP
jgi:hypothetical protein